MMKKFKFCTASEFDPVHELEKLFLFIQFQLFIINEELINKLEMFNIRKFYPLSWFMDMKLHSRCARILQDEKVFSSVLCVADGSLMKFAGIRIMMGF